MVAEEPVKYGNSEEKYDVIKLCQNEGGFLCGWIMSDIDILFL